VNKYTLKDEPPVEAREVDNVKVREGQIARLRRVKASRDGAAVAAALDALTEAAQRGGNLLEWSIRAMRLRATVGEVSDALERVFGRHRADTHKVTGVYAAAYDEARAGPTCRLRSPRSRTRTAAGRG